VEDEGDGVTATGVGWGLVEVVLAAGAVEAAGDEAAEAEELESAEAPAALVVPVGFVAFPLWRRCASVSNLQDGQTNRERERERERRYKNKKNER
jgi:hypothetical protein